MRGFLKLSFDVCCDSFHFRFRFPQSMCMRSSVLWLGTRGNMADAERNTEIVENSHDLTITEEQNTSIEANAAPEKETKEEPYNYGFSLLEYYKLCLQYYHKGT